MELVHQSLLTKLKNLLSKIISDDLFLLSSSISYYSALGIAPFILILLSISAAIGTDMQEKLIKQAEEISPVLKQMVEIIFSNVNQGVDISSLSGLIGIGVLLFTASIVFLKIRYGLDIIYGLERDKENPSILSALLERLFAMFVVFLAGLFLMITSSLPGALRIFGLNQTYYLASAFVLNFFVYIAMFWGIHFYAPSRHPKKRDALKMAVLSAVFFFIGNVLLGFYFSNIGRSSIYGAAGSLLVFLVWTYYSSFTMFLSVEFFLFYKRLRKSTIFH